MVTKQRRKGRKHQDRVQAPSHLPQWEGKHVKAAFGWTFTDVVSSLTRSSLPGQVNDMYIHPESGVPAQGHLCAWGLGWGQGRSGVSVIRSWDGKFSQATIIIPGNITPPPPQQNQNHSSPA